MRQFANFNCKYKFVLNHKPKPAFLLLTIPNFNHNFSDRVSGGRNPSHSLWANQPSSHHNLSHAPTRSMDAFAANAENNVYKSANLFAAAVPENILKLRAAIQIDENRVEALVSGNMFTGRNKAYEKWIQ